MMRTLILAFVGLVLSGCASIHVCDKGGETVATVNNTCWYLFNCIPLASGDHEYPNKVTTCFFRNTVTMQNNMKLLETAMRAHQAKTLRNIDSYTTDESVFFFLLTRHACYSSAELVIPQKEKEPSKDAL